MSKQESKSATATATNNRPVHTIRHRSIKATIWRNQTEKGPMFNVTIIRSYRDKESGQWKDSHSIGYDDLMNVAGLMYEAHGFISSQRAKSTAVKNAHKQ
jgi:hypothetical protein